MDKQKRQMHGGKTFKKRKLCKKWTEEVVTKSTAASDYRNIYFSTPMAANFRA